MAQDTTVKTRDKRAPRGIEKKRSCRVLVVDDDPLILDFLLEYLKRGDFNVTSAASGEDALLAIEQSDFDIVLVDLKMNGIDGLQTIEKITEIAPDIVTILMTGFPTLDSSVRALRLGASNYILKPFKLDEVDLALKKAAYERGVRRDMKNLRQRVSELELSVSGKREQIKINQKVGNQLPARAGKGR